MNPSTSNLRQRTEPLWPFRVCRSFAERRDQILMVRSREPVIIMLELNSRQYTLHSHKNALVTCVYRGGRKWREG